MINCRFYFSNLIHPQIRLVITLALWRNHIPTFWILGRASKSYWLLIWWFLERVLHLTVSYKTASKMLLQRSIILLISWEKQLKYAKKCMLANRINIKFPFAPTLLLLLLSVLISFLFSSSLCCVDLQLFNSLFIIRSKNTLLNWAFLGILNYFKDNIIYKFLGRNFVRKSFLPKEFDKVRHKNNGIVSLLHPIICTGKRSKCHFSLTGLMLVQLNSSLKQNIVGMLTGFTPTTLSSLRAKRIILLQNTMLVGNRDWTQQRET